MSFVAPRGLPKENLTHGISWEEIVIIVARAIYVDAKARDACLD